MLLAGHMALALRTHRDALRRQHVPEPPGLLELSELFLSWGRGMAPGADVLPGPAVQRMVLTVAEVAEVLAVSERTAKRLVASGELVSVLVGNSRRVRVSDLETYLERLGGPGGASEGQEGTMCVGSAGSGGRSGHDTDERRHDGAA